MSEQIREQVSAFLDGELPNSETELLLKRLTRDGELRESFGRYALIGEAVRGTTRGRIAMAPRGSGGFGYDPLFFSSDLGLSFAEAPMPAKQRVSHRGRAIRALVEVLVRRSK